MEIRGQTIVVTGAASGIGAALVRRFATEGAAGIGLLDISDGVDDVADEIARGGTPVIGAVVDMSHEDEVESAINRCEGELGPIDLFCSNAGVGGSGGCELPTEEWQWMWDVNLMAHVHTARLLIPRWLERGGGHMLITASAAGLLTQLGSAPYAVTKAAAVALAEWITITYGEDNVTASALCPQGVRTPMTEGMEESVAAVDGMLEPSAVAEAVIAGLAADQFLILPHPEVGDYVRFKGADRDKWIHGMRRLQATLPAIDF